MLLWLPMESLSPSSSLDANNPSHNDSDEKSFKLRMRDRRNRAYRCYKNSILTCLSVLMVCLVTFLQLRYPTVNTNQLLRSQKAARERALRSLPPDSIYRLSVPGPDGTSNVSLAQFAGKVSLVVNTACM
jgi:hypothetical protein